MIWFQRSCRHLEQVCDRTIIFRAFCYSATTHRRVIAIVATLTPRAKVFVRTVFRRVIEMRDGENDLDTFGVETVADVFVIALPEVVDDMPTAAIAVNNLMIWNAALFALVTSTRANPQTDLFPVFRVTRFVFRTNWHQADTLQMQDDQRGHTEAWRRRERPMPV